MSPSVEEILQLDPLACADVLHGEHLLAERTVARASILHWPAAEFARPDDLVLTTGVGCPRGKQDRFVTEIAERGVAALCFSIPFDEPVPETFVTVAAAHQLPIISLPWRVAFADVVHGVNTCLENRRRETQVGERTNLFEELVDGIPFDDDRLQIRRRAARLTGDEQIDFALLATPGEEQGSTPFDELAISRLKRRAARRGLDLIVLPRRRAVIGLVHLRGADAAEEFRELITELVDDDQFEDCRWALGDRPRSVRELKVAADQAATALRVGRWVGGQAGSPLSDARELAPFMMLMPLGDDPYVRAVAHEVIAPLKLYDEETGRNLVETLAVFLEEKCNSSSSARRLYMNRHSLLYRLNKIEALTGRSLNRSSDRFLFELCLRLDRFAMLPPGRIAVED